ncbi:chemotaxis protein CheX [Actomonas aquatica]|uniref:Chemotaxis protein CheX n=1 Tax=Actomonas aquatica TaxID=2866162 RepID=A0ABZ1C7C0_9BACT|nr:chemotaxis protein CheX [Opitutus sp. WL0086]WRQ87275.1 chemotaxis protein CheX [Opitutus sp. WL0086]
MSQVDPATTTAPNAIAPDIVKNAINRAVDTVCNIMLRETVEMKGASNQPIPAADGNGAYVIGSVGFVGDINGIVYLCFDEDFALFATQKALGMDRAEILLEGFELIKDTVGELTNMTVGNFKNVLCDAGHPCMLTLPTIIRAQKLSTGSSSKIDRVVYRYECAGHFLAADLQIRADAG